MSSFIFFYEIFFSLLFYQVDFYRLSYRNPHNKLSVGEILYNVLDIDIFYQLLLLCLDNDMVVVLYCFEYSLLKRLVVMLLNPRSHFISPLNFSKKYPNTYIECTHQKVKPPITLRI